MAFWGGGFCLVLLLLGVAWVFWSFGAHREVAGAAAIVVACIGVVVVAAIAACFANSALRLFAICFVI